MTKAKLPAFTLLTGVETITAAIDSIQRRGKKLDRDIQIAALSVMQHHADHGDTTLINRLIAAMPKGSRVNALKEYIETFGAVVYDNEGRKFKHSKDKTFRLDEAMSVMWTEFSPPQEYQSITDPNKLVNQLISRLEKDVKEMGDASKVDPAMLATLRNAVQPEVLH